MGVVVRELPRRAPGAARSRQKRLGAALRTPLQGPARRRPRVAEEQGPTESQSVEYMVGGTGVFVLYGPPFKLTTVLLWFGPLLLLAGGFAVLVRRVLRRRPEQDLEMNASERKRAAELLAGNEAERR